MHALEAGALLPKHARDCGQVVREFTIVPLAVAFHKIATGTLAVRPPETTMVQSQAVTFLD